MWLTYAFSYAIIQINFLLKERYIMKRILFQGDSITDAGRSFEHDYYLGHGYPRLVEAKLGCRNVGEYEFINRGISGNRSIDLLARVKADAINLKPDVMSILIGINDVWHELSFSNGVNEERYELYYKMFIDQVKEALPDIKIMIMEPFVLKASATEANWEAFKTGAEKRAVIAKKIADEYGLEFVPLADMFNEAAKKAEPSYWLGDGVHPTAEGHELIANEWIKAFDRMMGM